jgi:hypothetical protein
MQFKLLLYICGEIVNSAVMVWRARPLNLVHPVPLTMTLLRIRGCEGVIKVRISWCDRPHLTRTLKPAISVFISDRKGETQREKTTWCHRQRSEWCHYKPRTAGSEQKWGESGSRLPGNPRSPQPCGPLGCRLGPQNCENYIPMVLSAQVVITGKP